MLTAKMLIEKAEKMCLKYDKTKEKQKRFVRENLDKLLKEHSGEYILILGNSKPEFYEFRGEIHNKIYNSSINTPIYCGKIGRKRIKDYHTLNELHEQFRIPCVRKPKDYCRLAI